LINLHRHQLIIVFYTEFVRLVTLAIEQFWHREHVNAVLQYYVQRLRACAFVYTRGSADRADVYHIHIIIIIVVVVAVVYRKRARLHAPNAVFLCVPVGRATSSATPHPQTQRNPLTAYRGLLPIGRTTVGRTDERHHRRLCCARALPSSAGLA